MGVMSRRRFMRYGVGSAILAAVGLLTGYFLTRRPEATSGTGRLPPGQSERSALQVLHVDGVPAIDLGKWVFEVDGEVENPVKLSWNEFLQLPKTIDVSDFHCVTGWTKLDNKWEGVRFKEIAKLARPTVRAKYATIECYGGIVYTTSLPLEDLLRDDVLFAYGLDGKPLEPHYGGPLRLVVPQKYAYKSAKWVKRV
ncbi:molybdopterin-dependent oxidoreductase, partial [[Eubacterium] cellulosolvens]